jgi:hypothetical protein
MSKITVTIGKNGKASVKVEGLRDSSCLAKTKSLLKRLGIIRDQRVDPGVVVNLDEDVGVR